MQLLDPNMESGYGRADIILIPKYTLPKISFYEIKNKEAQNSDKNLRLCLNNHSRSKEPLDYWMNLYQALLGGFLYALDDYYIMHPNMESGYGRADIILEPRNKA